MGNPNAYGSGTPGNVAKYQSNPNNFSNFNTTPIYNNTMAQVGQQTGAAQQNIQDRDSAMGAGRSAGNAAALNQAAAGGQQQAANTAAQLGQYGYGQQLNQMNAQNQYNLNAYAQQANAYNNAQNRYSQNMSGALGPLGSAIAS